MKRRVVRIITISVVAISILINSLVVIAWLTDFMQIAQIGRLVYLIKTTSLQEVTIGGLIDGAANGMINGLPDPYSAVLDAEDITELQEQKTGTFGGIGVLIDPAIDSKLKIDEVYPGTPAYRAGLRKGDLIISIDGRSLNGMKAKAAADLLNGELGSELELSVIRGSNMPARYTLLREQIKVRSVTSQIINSVKPMGYIKIYSFNDATPSELKQTFEKMPNIQGVIVDLRDNPGGNVDSVIEAAEYFLPKGPVVHLIYRDGKRETLSVEGGKLRIPLVVMVNQHSASAAEILTAAIKDTGSGLIVGEKTFGKGLVQKVIAIDQTSGMKLTIAKYLSPLGTEIDSIGVKPDVEVLGSTDTDLVLARAKSLLLSRM